MNGPDHNKVMWITGASSGIGAALSIHCSRLGYRLILSSRDEPKLEEVKDKCLHPDKVRVLPLDLAEAETLQEKVSKAVDFFGIVDILVNNGGISQRSLVKHTQLSVDRRLMEINYFGTVALTKALLPHFIQQKSGHFAVVSSLVGKFGSPYRSSYAASKHALHGFFDSLRAEHHQDAILVTMICPGFVKTDVSVNALTGDGSPLNQMDDAQAKGLPPEECAKAMEKAIRLKRQEVYIGRKEVFGVYLKRFFPSAFSNFIKKAKVR
ncbi:SDR family oxidoreductase [Pararhodonellum marinum]|uniref:SDR family oxidoreductase n=1 Tax=Pararhodonellum marinum TaxID=2755358 RepID=UPI00188E9FFD|nr:SDR family oxidoreductase [Pararhodonellum marinum]